MKEKKSILLLVLVGFIVYIPALFNGFVGDDFLQIIDNTSVHSLSNFLQFFTGSTFASGGSEAIAGLYYRPLMMSIFAFCYSFFRTSSLPYHLIQLFLHLCNTVLLFLFLRYFFKKSYSFIISFIFLLHPINSEAVLYSANLQDTLFFFFGISALLFIQRKDFRYKNYLITFFCFLLSLLAKETGIVFLISGVIYSGLFQKKKFRWVFNSAILSLLFYLVLRFGVAKMYLAQGSIAPIYRAALLMRILNIPAIVSYYFKTFLLPFSLGVDQYWIVTRLSFSEFYVPLINCIIFMILCVSGGIYLRRKQSGKLFLFYVYFFLWFFVGMMLHLQFIPLDATVADRWFYFPIVGLLGMLGVFVSTIAWKRVYFSKYLIVLLWFICGVLGLVTFFRCFNWRDDLSLYGHDITTTKNNFVLDNAYATALISNSQFADAKPYATQSVKIYPYYANVNNMAIIAVAEKNYPEAEKYFSQATKISNNYMVYQNYSSFLLHFGKLADADAFTRRALRLFPKNDVLHANMIEIQKKINK